MKNLFLKFVYKVLAFYAKSVIGKFKPIVIAITGSVGKTSTKEAIYQVLFDQYGRDVRKTPGNLNAEIGLPLTILGYENLPNKFFWPIFLVAAWLKTQVKTFPRILILEMGVEKNGDIKYLTGIAKPDYVIVTSTSPAHIANFKNIEEFEKEKMSIIQSMKPNGKAILNYDDKNLAKVSSPNIVSYGIENVDASYKARNISSDFSGTEFRIERTGSKISIKSKLLGKQFVYSDLAAFAIGDLFAVQLLKIAGSLEKIKPVPGRMNLIEGRDGIKVIDDTYNANPSSVKAALDSLSEIKISNGRKVLILGNMNELGSMEKALHREVAKYAKDKCDLAIFVGKNADIMKESFGEKNTKSFSTRDELLANIDSIVEANDLVLIKASQNGNFFEEVVKYLMKDKKEAGTLLVRQSKFWMKKKGIKRNF